MRNKGWALVLVAVLLAMAATPVLADRASNGPGEMQIKPVEQFRWRTSNTIFSLVGAVTAVGEDSITFHAAPDGMRTSLSPTIRTSKVRRSPRCIASVAVSCG